MLEDTVRSALPYLPPGTRALLAAGAAERLAPPALDWLTRHARHGAADAFIAALAFLWEDDPDPADLAQVRATLSAIPELTVTDAAPAITDPPTVALYFGVATVLAAVDARATGDPDTVARCLDLAGTALRRHDEVYGTTGHLAEVGAELDLVGYWHERVTDADPARWRSRARADPLAHRDALARAWSQT